MFVRQIRQTCRITMRRQKWKKEHINQIREEDKKFMALEKEWLQKMEEKF